MSQATVVFLLGFSLFSTFGCATTGRKLAVTDPDTLRRAEGISLGSTGSPLGLALGQHYMPMISIYRESENNNTTGYYLFARIVTPHQALKIESATFTREDNAQRKLSARTHSYWYHRAAGGLRHVEEFKVALSKEDVHWLAEARENLDIYIEGEHVWATTKLSANQVRALRLFHHIYILGKAEETFGEKGSIK